MAPAVHGLMDALLTSAVGRGDIEYIGSVKFEIDTGGFTDSGRKAVLFKNPGISNTNQTLIFVWNAHAQYGMMGQAFSAVCSGSGIITDVSDVSYSISPPLFHHVEITCNPKNYTFEFCRAGAKNGTSTGYGPDIPVLSVWRTYIILDGLNNVYINNANYGVSCQGVFSTDIYRSDKCISSYIEK